MIDHVEMCLVVRMMRRTITEQDIIDNDLSSKPELIWLEKLSPEMPSAHEQLKAVSDFLENLVDLDYYKFRLDLDKNAATGTYMFRDQDGMLPWAVIDEIERCKEKHGKHSYAINYAMAMCGWSHRDNYGSWTVAFRDKVCRRKFHKKIVGEAQVKLANQKLDLFVKKCLNV